MAQKCLKYSLARFTVITFLCAVLSPVIANSEITEKTKSTSVEEEVYGVKYASNCEVCKLLVTELEGRLQETGKSHDVLQTGYNFDGKRPTKKYSTSELRLIESMDNICDTLLNYNIHKERTDSSRFAKGMSSTFKTLHGLVDKGVNVDLGIPYELWDKPSAEVTFLKTQCEKMIEEHEQHIEQWYFHHQQQQPLMQYLCQDRVLRKGDAGCLHEKVADDSDDQSDQTDSVKSEL